MLTANRSTRSWVLSSLVLAGAVLIVSSAAILVRLAQAEGVASISIAAWRLGFASLVLLLLVSETRAARHEIAALPTREALLCAASGVFLAAHFAAWISSLQYTSVASSTALVTTNPIWIALLSWLVLRERPGIWLACGIACAIGGGGLILISDARPSGADGVTTASLGNMLALVGSLTVCGYLLIGRRLRATMTLLPYILLVYSAAAVTLWVAALLSGASLIGYSSLAWVCLLALAVGPQLLGHTCFNWALKHYSAGFVAVVILAEPVGSAMLAWWLFDEDLAPLQLTGFVLLLFGVYLAARGEARSGVQPTDTRPIPQT